MNIKYHIISAALLLLMGGTMLTSCKNDGGFDYDKAGFYISDTEASPVVTFAVEDTPASYDVTVRSTKQVENDVTVSLALDLAKVEEYNKLNGTSYQPIPQNAVQLENAQVTIKEGTAISTSAAVRVVSTEDFTEGVTYVIPVSVTQVSGSDNEVLPGSKTIYLKISRIINFFSIQANPNASSNFIFDKTIPLSTLTYEMKIYPQGLNRTNYPQRFMALEQEDESKSLLLRFNEANSDNKLQVILSGNRFLSNTEFENGQWYLLSIVCDGSNISLYVNGELDASIAGSIEGGSLDFKRYEMGMSWGRNYPRQQFFAHRFCEIRIWDYARSATEIKGGMCGVDPKSEGLKAYWKFNEGEGHIFKDASGNGFDMDWTNTSRDPNENGVMVATPDAANNIQWVKDDINKCIQ
ncbi:MAG: DUF1735 and LamG domain-containing protein [Prevotella sp.]|nr:DUF1735 and LamG domain-containing protein [Prevotella sp.]